METILAPNTRIGQIKRYLSKPHPKAARLLMGAASEGGTQIQLGEWPIDEVTPELAMTIVAVLDEHCAEMKSSVKATLSCRDEENRQVGGIKVLSRSPQHMDDDTSAGLASALTGDATSLVVQAQRHTEVMVRMLAQTMSGQLHTMQRTTEHAMELCESLATRLAESESRESKAKRDAEEMRAALAELAVPAEESDTAKAQERVLNLLQPFLLRMMAPAPTPPKA